LFSCPFPSVCALFFLPFGQGGSHIFLRHWPFSSIFSFTFQTLFPSPKYQHYFHLRPCEVLSPLVAKSPLIRGEISPHHLPSISSGVFDEMEGVRETFRDALYRRRRPSRVFLDSPRWSFPFSYGVVACPSSSRQKTTLPRVILSVKVGPPFSVIFQQSSSLPRFFFLIRARTPHKMKKAFLPSDPHHSWVHEVPRFLNETPFRSHLGGEMIRPEPARHPGGWWAF